MIFGFEGLAKSCKLVWHLHEWHGVVIWGVEKREGGRMRYPVSPGSPSSEAEEEKEVAHAIPPSDHTNDSLAPKPLFPLCFFSKA